MGKNQTNKLTPDYRSKAHACLINPKKVYTIHDESRHLIIKGIPAIGVAPEFIDRCCQYGQVDSHHVVAEADETQEPFTETIQITFSNIQEARYARRKLKQTTFYGGSLQVAYAPQNESMDDTLCKLILRRGDVLKRLPSSSYSRRLPQCQSGGTVPLLQDPPAMQPPLSQGSLANTPAPQNIQFHSKGSGIDHVGMKRPIENDMLSSWPFLTSKGGRHIQCNKSLNISSMKKENNSNKVIGQNIQVHAGENYQEHMVPQSHQQQKPVLKKTRRRI